MLDTASLYLSLIITKNIKMSIFFVSAKLISSERCLTLLGTASIDGIMVIDSGNFKKKIMVVISTKKMYKKTDYN